jgi:YVTN family beta-propeller protein
MARTRLALLVSGLCILAGAAGIREASGSSAFPRTIAISGDPVTVAVDSLTKRAFVVNDVYSTVSVLDTVSGNVLRAVPIGQGAYALAVDEHLGRVFVPSAGDDSLTILDANTGSVLRTIALGYSPNLVTVNTPAGRVYVTSTDGTMLTILDGHDGKRLYSVALPSEPLAMAANQNFHQVLLATASGMLEARDAGTGALLHATPIGGYPAALAVDAMSRRIFVANGDDATVRMLDARTGVLLHTAHVPSSPVAMTVVAAAGRIVVASSLGAAGSGASGSVSVLDATTGQLLATTPMDGSPLAILPDERSRDALIDINTAILDVDATTGATIRSLPVRGMRVTGQAMAIDERTGHIFVVNTDDSNATHHGSILDWARQWLPFMRGSASPYGSVDEYEAAH